MRALVVDDSAVMRKIPIGVLGRMGIADVTQAGDGAEAVRAVEQGDFGLVLMDWNMPTMLGIDAVRAIRGKGKQMPIVMVTSEAEKSRILEAVQAGATNYLLKPFDQDAAASKLQAVLQKAASGG